LIFIFSVFRNSYEESFSFTAIGIKPQMTGMFFAFWISVENYSVAWNNHRRLTGTILISFACNNGVTRKPAKAPQFPEEFERLFFS
jgi:hypothetical protein